MNRVIKFRAWNGKAMEFGGFSIHCTAGNVEPLKGLTDVTKDSPIMQYTGLKDKNGRDIYEGDILDCEDRIVKVVWHNEAGCFDCDFIKYIFSLKSNGCTNQEWKYRAVIIGNIHQNPELIK